MTWNGFKRDLTASVVVFLVAIPLCLGIALASGAPLYSGIIAGIIGGLLVGLLSESPVSVSGPAAGMVAIVLSSIAALGSFHAFLLALVFAGIIQIMIGAIRAGFLADYVPSTVIQGLLAAIGIIIILKQLPLALGMTGDVQLTLSTLRQAQEGFSLTQLIALFHHINVSASLITLVSLVVLIFWEKVTFSFRETIPAAVVVVVLAVIVNLFLGVVAPTLSLPNSHLVNIPVNENIIGLFSQLPHPLFSDWVNPSVYLYAGVIAIVASLETLLNLEAAQRMDPLHRFCSRNKELVAQGVGNIVSGFLGGLPITSVVVRTTVNIQSRNHSKLATIMHGGLLLLALLLIPTWLNRIPLAALAAILIVTGYKLARVAVFKDMYQQGKSYFTAFIVTVFSIVFTNLLLGVLIGLSVGLFFILRVNSRNKFMQIKEKHASGEVLRIKLPQQVTFLNKAAMVNVLNSIPKKSKVIIDANNTDYIDKDILSVMKEFSQFQAVRHNISLNFIGLQAHYALASRQEFITATTFDVQSKILPQDIIQILQEGNQRFVNDTPIHKDFKRQISLTSASQHPIAVVLSCIDSRVPVEHVFDLNLGDVFVVRIAGNIINPDILASIEFACEIAGAKLILVLGHRRCGAITAACEGVELGHLSQLLAKIKPAIKLEENVTLSGAKAQFATVDRVACVNVDLVQLQLYKESEILRKLFDSKKIGFAGAMYDLDTGEVTFEKIALQPSQLLPGGDALGQFSPSPS